MVRILGLCGMLAVVLAWPVQAQSDPCQAAEREMAYGAAAVEDSKDKAGFLRAARQFEGATRSAPRCAAARFNLGVAYEKAGQLQAAKDAYGHYLRLAPNAPDARSVRQRMYKLEYRVGRAKARTNLAGSWEDKSLKNRYRIDMAGPRFDIYHISYCPWQDCSKRRYINKKQGYGTINGRKISGIYIDNGVWEHQGCKNPPRTQYQIDTSKSSLSADGKKLVLWTRPGPCRSPGYFLRLERVR